MDTDEEYVEVYDDEDDDLNVPVSESRAKQPSQLRRYKDDAYRCSSWAVHLLLPLLLHAEWGHLYPPVVPVHPVHCFQLWKAQDYACVQTLYPVDTQGVCGAGKKASHTREGKATL